MVKNVPAVQETGLDPQIRKIPWRRKWQPIPVFLLGDSHGQRSPAGYSLWGYKELDMTEWLILSLLKKILIYFNWRLITLQYCGFSHTLTWVSHGCTCVPHPEPHSHLPPHPISRACPGALAVSVLLYASNLDWSSILHMVIYMCQCYSLKSSHPHLMGINTSESEITLSERSHTEKGIAIWSNVCTVLKISNQSKLKISQNTDQPLSGDGEVWRQQQRAIYQMTHENL